jgi:putative PIN family toxin of toxin-antitoxin system
VGAPPAQVASRVVFDTAVVVSALVFPKGRLAWMRDSWRSRDVVPLVSRPTVEELIRVLAYPKFKLAGAEREDLLGDFLPYAEVPKTKPSGAALPRCRDPGDQMFIELADASNADAVVTGDDDLLVLARRFKIPILTPEAWRRRARP